MADSEQVQCQFCKGTYKKRGLANHQRSCKQKPQDVKPGQSSGLSPGKVSPAEKSDKKQSETVQCEYCGRAFKKGGLATHQRSCEQKPQISKQHRKSSDLQASNILPVATPEQKQEQSNTRQCQYCGGTYTRKGLATHQRACKQKHVDHGENSETLTGGSVFSETVTDPVQAYNTLATSEQEQEQSNTRQCQYCSGTYTRKGLATHQRACKQKHGEDSETSTGGSVFSETVTGPVQAYNTLATSEQEQEQSNTRQCQYCSGTYTRKGLATHQRACKQKHVDHGEDSETLTGGSVFSETPGGHRCYEGQKSGLGLGSRKSMSQIVKNNNPGSSSSIPSEIGSGALNTDLPPIRFLSPKDRTFLNKEIKSPNIWPVIAADIRWDGSAERKREPCDVVLSAVGESFLEMLKLFRRVEARAHVDMKKSLEIISVSMSNMDVFAVCI
ncbi:zinc finger protein 474 isoform X1 [Lingula anatina]|uniref:Zinc finger protein 474 isoform X1 n=1 Tax=Lingula anatina TaxID=7574 RepID=A0A1S3IW90_LINAN|nr:zinc finger protein 474 isoform X1 [Lingula anatina]|eukprot:XP_013402231.1 zinc finger protein 474 isoform X1 [Lingula anatina]